MLADSYLKVAPRDNIEEVKRKIERIKSAIESFPLEQLEIVEDFSVHIVFPLGNIFTILVDKHHSLSNKEKICLCYVYIKMFID